MHRLAIPLLLILSACGGGGGGGAATAAPPEILAISAALDAAAGTAFSITGTSFPGTVSDVVLVRFTAAEGTPFNGCRAATLERPCILASSTEVRGSAPTTVMIGAADCYVSVRFAGGSELTSATPIARFEGAPDASIDHDMDGVHDRCDPDTYDFEDDAPGSRPAGTKRVDGITTGFVTVNASGDHGAHYADALSSGSSDTLERLRADHPHQDLTAYIDLGPANGGRAHVEFWADGSYHGNAGAGLLLQAFEGGDLRLYQRTRRGLTVEVGPPTPASGRIRVRLNKGAGDTSTMYIDTWVNGAWTLDAGTFPIADDRWFTGREVALAEYAASTRAITRITVLYDTTAAPLTLFQQQDGATDWKVFQRDAAGEATIPLRFAYTLAAAGRVEARVVGAGTTTALPGHDWSDHTLALGAATNTRAALDIVGVPTGGNYDIELRLFEGAGAAPIGTATLSEVAVGDVYLCIGQSNMAGYSHSLAGATVPVDQVHAFRNRDLWTQATEPMDESFLQRDGRSAENPAHSLMLPFGTSLFAATGVPVGLIPAPLGGTNLYSQWQRYAPDPDHRGTLYGSALRRAALHGGNPLRGILWYQGESDSIGGRTEAQYVADLEQLVAQYRADLSAPEAIFLCVQLGTWSAGGFPNWTNIQEAQRKVCRADPLARLATVHDLARSDGIHYSVAGYQELGRRLAEQARVLLFGHVIDPLTELDEAVAVSGGTAVELRYDAPVTGGQASLFQVSDGLGVNAVTGVAASGSTVTLQLTRALSGPAFVRYGMSAVPAVAWVFDAAGVAVPAFGSVPITQP